MLRLGAIFRAFMFLACLVPFTSSQQAAGALAPILPVVPAREDAPAAPAREEDDERETDGKERVSSQARHHPPLRELADRLAPAHTSNRSQIALVCSAPPVAEDPFRNGLGTPYRC